MMKLFVRPLTAILLAVVLALGSATPSFAQSAGQNPSTPAQTTVGTGTVPAVSLGMAKYNYSRSPKGFPNLIAPYTGADIPSPELANSPKIEQMIHDGKLEISLQDAIELSLQNNLDIVVARYNVWYADTDLLRTSGGGFGRGTAGASFPFSQANVPGLSFDPIVTGTFSWGYLVTPVNNPILAGTGTATLTTLPSHNNQYNLAVSQGFSPGTTLSVAWYNTRSSSSSSFNFFNPSVQSALYVNVSQQLLNGFGRFVNRRNIMISKNNRRIADLAFSQQAITTITNTITAYWELAYARENVNVQQQAVTVADKLYNDNKKQLEIGTMAPLDVTRAESELATDRQNLIVAQTAQLQQQQALRNAISKDPMAPNLVNVEIVTSDKPTPPALVEAASFEESVKEAFGKRPDLLEQEINLQNAGIDAKANKNALLPVATLNARYGSQGLAGNSLINGTPVTSAGSQIVDQNGAPVILVDSSGTAVPVFEPLVTTPTIGVNKEGLGSAQSQIFHNQFPDYSVAINLNIPIRNRVAQADYQRAVLTQRQTEAQLQQLKNAAILDVRNTYIALIQNRARVEAAGKARELQRQTFDAEQKKYQLGASTVYNVILTQRDFITAQGTELRALADLVESKANYERALGRTLEVNRVTIADAKTGQPEKENLIPGTLDGKVVGTDALFKRLEAASPAPSETNSGNHK
jgi:outer membrane protein TolC